MTSILGLINHIINLEGMGEGMKKLLIVEDEKMIRLGIQAMVKRSPVHFEEIILCKNGEEAFEVVKNQKIDIMITDIRMPKMDGITLVKKIQSLSHKPKVVVISGYDEFSYAVELLRNGAKEYILKPVEREKISQILVKLEKELDAEQERQEDKTRIGYQQFKYLLLNENITDEEITAIENKFKDCFLKEEYVVCCTNYQTDADTILDDLIFLDDIHGQSIFIVKAAKKDELLSSVLRNYYVGISKQHKSLMELRKAYQEALYARKNAFATGNFIAEYNKDKEKEETIAEEMIDQFVQLVGTDKCEEAYKFLARILYKTKQGCIDPDHFQETMEMIVEKVCTNYQKLLDTDEIHDNFLRNVYAFDNAASYYYALKDWLTELNEKIVNEFDDYKNKQKIQRAIVYIHENYNKDLNMAVVSNYISMNYSLFSLTFKQYTGTNFVHYLKTIRINQAKKLLEETDLKIIEISNRVGYENEKHFMKLFKCVCGVSPSEYRKNVQVGKIGM